MVKHRLTYMILNTRTGELTESSFLYSQTFPFEVVAEDAYSISQAVISLERGNVLLRAPLRIDEVL